jgi:hypothetical protein
MIGKIQRIPIREVWKHEARDFTPWLQNNIEILNEILDFKLNTAEREQQMGNFSVDLIAEDSSGNPVVIENQFGKSDHDHLGKLLTYLTTIDAKTAIWIAEDPRPEHINTITWLNESSSASFYFTKVEAVKILDSAPAPLFTLIVGPSEEIKIGDKIKKNLAEKDKLRFEFWTLLLKKAKEKTKLHSSISPSIYNWLGASSGIPGLSFNYSIRQHGTSVELYIDKGSDSKEENKKIFKKLFSSKEEIESALNGKLNWVQSESYRGCSINKKMEIGGYLDKNKWDKIIEVMIDTMIRFAKVFKPHIKKLDL